MRPRVVRTPSFRGAARVRGCGQTFSLKGNRDLRVLFEEHAGRRWAGQPRRMARNSSILILGCQTICAVRGCGAVFVFWVRVGGGASGTADVGSFTALAIGVDGKILSPLICHRSTVLCTPSKIRPLLGVELLRPSNNSSRHHRRHAT